MDICGTMRIVPSPGSHGNAELHTQRLTDSGNRCSNFLGLAFGIRIFAPTLFFLDSASHSCVNSNAEPLGDIICLCRPERSIVIIRKISCQREAARISQSKMSCQGAIIISLALLIFPLHAWPGTSQAICSAVLSPIKSCDQTDQPHGSAERTSGADRVIR